MKKGMFIIIIGFLLCTGLVGCASEETVDILPIPEERAMTKNVEIKRFIIRDIPYGETYFEVPKGLPSFYAGDYANLMEALKNTVSPFLNEIADKVILYEDDARRDPGEVITNIQLSDVTQIDEFDIEWPQSSSVNHDRPNCIMTELVYTLTTIPDRDYGTLHVQWITLLDDNDNVLNSFMYRYYFSTIRYNGEIVYDSWEYVQGDDGLRLNQLTPEGYNNYWDYERMVWDTDYSEALQTILSPVTNHYLNEENDWTYDEYLRELAKEEAAANNSTDTSSNSSKSNWPDSADSSWNTLESIGAKITGSGGAWYAHLGNTKVQWTVTPQLEYAWKLRYKPGDSYHSIIDMWSTDGITYTCTSQGGGPTNFYGLTVTLTKNGVK